MAELQVQTARDTDCSPFCGPILARFVAVAVTHITQSMSQDITEYIPVSCTPALSDTLHSETAQKTDCTPPCGIV